MDIKKQLYQQCEVFIENRLVTVQKSIEDIQNALLSETKSSAGDKHETGRAMMQLEREKAGQQLAEIQKTKNTLSKINLDNPSDTISLGSVVYTSIHNYFISISAGELMVETQTFYAISPNTPIAKLLIGKTTGDRVSFRGQEFKVQMVL
ncbi:3-oxoacyl-ACP synthase [Hyunsoonleella rubra]|uniref:3-oxoacyl-ACP synthase n=1 Tax=Hyunsoonleella rubra TaxID=1737062 RepID=A0ABW5T8X4_9FLAO